MHSYLARLDLAVLAAAMLEKTIANSKNDVAMYMVRGY